ncbi:NAD(P)-binding protein, partial [Escherichia coli]|nr:NAD(P)-binding protein [Escherichia coli]
SFSDGNIQIPAQFSRGRLSLAISTDGASPLLTKRIKEDLSSNYDESYTQYTQFLYECRVLIHRLNVSKSRKHELLTEIIDDQYRLSLVKQREFL